MRDSNEKRIRKRPVGRELEDALERSMPSYTPQHRRAVLQGMRILARVAIRSYLEEKAARSRDEGEGDSR